jgi:hypothetical protein
VFDALTIPVSAFFGEKPRRGGDFDLDQYAARGTD